MLQNKHAKGFTLIELLIVIAIVAILAAVVILTLNPAQLLAQSRDSNRISDLATLKSAVSLYLADVSDLVTYPIAPSYGTCYAATTSTFGVSTGCNGWLSTSYATNNNSSSRAVDGSGWLPVNFTRISAGSPLGNLPSDPVGLTSAVYYYAYAATSSGGYTFEIDANMESTKYACSGGGDVESTDGGSRNACTNATSSLYEVGTDPGLDL